MKISCRIYEEGPAPGKNCEGLIPVLTEKQKVLREIFCHSLGISNHGISCGMLWGYFAAMLNFYPKPQHYLKCLPWLAGLISSHSGRKAPGVVMTDTTPFRYLYYYTQDDTPKKIDYDRPAYVTGVLKKVAAALEGCRHEGE